VLGTAFYLSPEQAAGDEVGPPSDIYSLGIVAYECLTGRRPFAGTNPVAVALAHQREQAPPLPPELPLQVRELVNRAMAKNPPDRPPTAGDFGRAALALRDGLEGTRPMPAMGMPPTARLAGTRPAGTAVLPRTGPQPPRRPEPSGPSARRRRSLRAPLIGLILLALLIGLFVLLRTVNGGTGVPDVKGLSLARAQTSLRAAGFQVKVNGGSSGVVQSQDPSAGHKAKKSSTVTLTFGNQQVEPAKTRINSSDYVGRRLSDVRSDLTGLGFGVSLSGSTSPDALVTSISPTGEVTNGSVISVTSRRQQTASPSPTEQSSAPSTSTSTSTSPPQTSEPSSSPPNSSGGGGNGGLTIPGVGKGKGNGNGGGNGNG
jgi:serine/threonine-protein kinase